MDMLPICSSDIRISLIINRALRVRITIHQKHTSRITIRSPNLRYRHIAQHTQIDFIGNRSITIGRSGLHKYPTVEARLRQFGCSGIRICGCVDIENIIRDRSCGKGRDVRQNARRFSRIPYCLVDSRNRKPIIDLKSILFD